MIDKKMDNTKSTHSLSIQTPNGSMNIPVTISCYSKDDWDMKTILTAKICDNEICIDAESTEEALQELAKALPDNIKIHSCISCKFGHFCPVGNGDNEIFCVADFEPTTQSDLYYVTENDDERSKRMRTLFHLCDKFEYQTEDCFTHNDFLFNTKK